MQVDEDEELRRAAEASELEAKLRGDVIVEVSPAQSLPGAHAGKRRVVLESGLICIAKPDGGCPDWPHAAACEAAAWIVARSLRLPCLVPVTVGREIPLPEGGSVFAALQAWQEPYDADRRERFPESEQRWAAVFDYLIQQGDRDGHNWLVYLDDEGQPHLKLTDHGYAFGAPGRPLRSTFYTEHRGLAFDAQMRAALRGLQDVRFAKDLETLLPRELISALLERVELLLNLGHLP